MNRNLRIALVVVNFLLVVLHVSVHRVSADGVTGKRAATRARGSADAAASGASAEGGASERELLETHR